MNNELFNNKYYTQQRINSEKTHSNFWFSSNKDIISSLWKSYALLRINRWLRQEDIVDMTGVSISTIRRFEAWNTIALDSFLKLIRAIWRIEDIDCLLTLDEEIDDFDYDRVRA